MPISQAKTADLVRRQAFNGKGLLFIEVMFDQEQQTVNTGMEASDSPFFYVTQIMSGSLGGTLLAASYYTDRTASELDGSEVTKISADSTVKGNVDEITVYQYIVEGGPEIFNNADTAGDVNQAETATTLTDAQTDLEARVLTAITSAAGAGDSTQATAIGVRIRYLPADGIGSSGSQSVFGMFDGRGTLGQGLDG